MDYSPNSSKETPRGLHIFAVMSVGILIISSNVAHATSATEAWNRNSKGMITPAATTDFVGIGTAAPFTMLDIKDVVRQPSFVNNGFGSLNIAGGNGSFLDYATLTFSDASGIKLGKIGAQKTSSGSSLFLGTSNNFTSGITNAAIAIDSTGNTSLLNLITKGPYIDVRAFGATSTDSADDTAAIRNAIAALPSTGGTLLFAPGTYYVSAPLSFDDKTNIKLVGEGAPRSNADKQTVNLIYTGESGSLITAHGTRGLEISQINLAYGNYKYGDVLIDLSQGVGKSNTTWIHIHDCRIGGTPASSRAASALVLLNLTNDLNIERCMLSNAKVGILGSTISVINANRITLKNNWFNYTFGVSPIVAGGQAWTIDSNIFEPIDGDGGIAKAFDTTSVGVNGFSYIGNWHGDAGSGTWLQATGGPINGGYISGNIFQSTGGAGIDLGKSSGVSIVGNRFEELTAVVAGGASSVTIAHNSLKSYTATLISGTPAKNSFLDTGKAFSIQGNLGIGTLTPTAHLDVASNALGASSYAAPSDTLITATLATLNTGDVARVMNLYDSGGGMSLGGLSVKGNYTGAGHEIALLGESGVSVILGTANAENFRINKDGKIGIGLSMPAWNLSVNGTIGAKGIGKATAGTNQDLCYRSETGEFIVDTTGTCIISSKRFKHDIQKLVASGISIISSLTPSTFVRNGESATRYGFIAEEVAAVDEHLASYGEDGLPRGLDDHALISILVKAVQEQQAEILKLQEEIHQLKK